MVEIYVSGVPSIGEVIVRYNELLRRYNEDYRIEMMRRNDQRQLNHYHNNKSKKKYWKHITHKIGKWIKIIILGLST